MKRKSDQKRTETISFRCEPRIKYKLRWIADNYFGGNMSEMMIEAGLNVERRSITLNETRRK